MPGKKPRAKRAQLPVAEGRCKDCGHWSPATEFGLDEKSGYCDHWEKITDAAYGCPDWISRAEFAELQEQLAEEHEEYLDDDTG